MGNVVHIWNKSRWLGPIAAVVLAACAEEGEVSEIPITVGEAPTVEPGTPVLKRLTEAQYANTIGDLFGGDVVLPSSLEPDVEVDGLFAVGAGVTTISPLGVEQYETGAYLIAEQVMAPGAIRDAVMTCSPSGVVDDACASEALEDLGRKIWRRPLTDSELGTLTAVAGEAADVLGDFYLGLEYGLAALLQSPHFLYRVELAEGQDTPRAYTDWEMASRLSYFLWNTTPDDELLDAASAGELTDDAGLAAQVERMLADDRAIQGVRNLFSEMLELYDLPGMTKDPDVYTSMSDDLGESAREETLMGIEAHVFTDDADYRELFTTHRTFVDRQLAALYDVPAPTVEGFGEVWLPLDGERRGFLGQASFLALQSHSVSTSVTRRGMFVRENLLCQTIPPPPADLNTAIPEPDPTAPTMRDRVQIHLLDPVCASCHQITDPIGLGLENFDGIGKWRVLENGAEIDPSGDLDGVEFTNGWELAGAIAAHPELPLCFTSTVYQYANGASLTEGEAELLEWHLSKFAVSGHSVLTLLADIAQSPGFRNAGEVL